MDFSNQRGVSFTLTTEPAHSQSGEVLQKNARSALNFIDLFAGLGGFHVALTRLGHKCVFASELDSDLGTLYKQNFGIQPHGDIREIEADNIPPHDILCAGFPCQPFSLAGKQAGAKCPASGKLIDDVIRITKHHEPRYVLLENVPNVLTIESGKFWGSIKRRFASLGYELQHRIYSPEEFGIPQRRNRLFIVAVRDGLKDFNWPDPAGNVLKPLLSYIKQNTIDARQIEPAKIAILEKWNALLPHITNIRADTILAAEFGATYPLSQFDPNSETDWRKYKGAFGASLSQCKSWDDAVKLLPHYAASRNGALPAWVKPYVSYSRALYSRSPALFDKWKRDLVSLPNSWQKFEWRGDREQLDIWKHTIQFRASGIRIMRPDFAPSLVAMTLTQTPIIGSVRRYIGIREAAALQSLETLDVFPKTDSGAFKALGNAVNAHIVEAIAEQLIH
jgi:DNA (cytosine-5)-methyltransferase 1